MVDIEDIIAEARAEEEAKRKPIDQTPVMVTISLDQYKELVLESTDLDRIITAISDGFSASRYTEGRIKFDGDRVVETFRALYPTDYDMIEQDLLSKQEISEDE